MKQRGRLSDKLDLRVSSVGESLLRSFYKDCGADLVTKDFIGRKCKMSDLIHFFKDYYLS